MPKALYTDDSVNTCDCCGRTGLKYTVVVELDSGERAHYGSTCATRNTGKSDSTLRGEMKAHHEASIAAARAEYMRHPAYLAECARLAERNRVMPGAVGRVAADFVRDAREAASVVRREICTRHGVNFVL